MSETPLAIFNKSKPRGSVSGRERDWISSNVNGFLLLNFCDLLFGTSTFVDREAIVDTCLSQIMASKT